MVSRQYLSARRLSLHGYLSRLLPDDRLAVGQLCRQSVSGLPTLLEQIVEVFRRSRQVDDMRKNLFELGNQISLESDQSLSKLL